MQALIGKKDIELVDTKNLFPLEAIQLGQK